MESNLAGIKTELARVLSRLIISTGQIEPTTLINGNDIFFQKVLSKYGKWIHKFNITQFIIAEINKYCENKTGKLIELLKTNELINIQDSFIELLRPIPYDIYFYLPVPSVAFLDRHFSINENITYTNFSEEEIQFLFQNIILKNPPNFVSKDELHSKFTNKTYIIIKGTGFLDNARKGSALNNALHKLKQILVAATSSNLLINNPFARKTVDYLNGLFFYSPLPHISHNMDYGLLSYDITTAVFGYLSNNEFLFSQIFNAEETKKQIIKFGALIDQNESVNMLHVSNSVEWTFNALANDNMTFRFVQTCIALESILGDTHEDNKDLKKKLQDINPPNTKLLAERLSYLIAGKKSERKEVRDTFFKIYQLRSNLVHGKDSVFSLNSLDLLDKAQQYLLKAIDRELYLNTRG